jgi:hypothetical protein
MRQATLFWTAAVLASVLNRPAFAEESAALEQAQLVITCQKHTGTHCDDPHPYEPFAGSTKWSTESLPVGADQKPRVAVRADVEIPSRGATMKWLMYPNGDKDLPAGQFDAIHLELPADLQPAKPFVVIGFLTVMANSALGAGDPLETDGKGAGEKVGDWSFPQPLNPDAEHNFKLIEEHCWFQVHTIEFPVINGVVNYSHLQPHLVISMEKGKAGARAFADAFAAWGTTYAERSCTLSLAPPSERQAAHDRIVTEARADIVDGVFGKR